MIGVNGPVGPLRPPLTLRRFLDETRLSLALAGERRAIVKAGFWFVDVPRTGSSSIKTELTGAFGKTFGKSGKLTTNDPALIEDHRTAQEMERFLTQRAWRRLFTFTFVRNPWSRMYSLFKYRRDLALTLPKTMDFNEYAQKLSRPQYTYPHAHSPYCSREFYYSCSDYLCDRSGKLMVSFAGRFEAREDALAAISERLGLQLGTGRHLLRTSEEGNDYRKHYEPTTIDIVGAHFAEDVRRFGYTF